MALRGVLQATNEKIETMQPMGFDITIATRRYIELPIKEFYFDAGHFMRLARDPAFKGYMIAPTKKDCAIFVNYHKDDSISDSTNYEDFFVNNNEFEWMSKSDRTLASSDVKSILGHNGQIRLLLFIKKNNDEGMDFYYMGDIKPQLNNVYESKMPNNLSVVKIRFDLINSVPDNLFKYLNEK
jgi:hypothetical protein